MVNVLCFTAFQFLLFTGCALFCVFLFTPTLKFVHFSTSCPPTPFLKIRNRITFTSRYMRNSALPIYFFDLADFLSFRFLPINEPSEGLLSTTGSAS